MGSESSLFSKLLYAPSLKGNISNKDESYRLIALTDNFLTAVFIDGHVHIESSMVSPVEFAKVVVPVGTSTLIADPHEIALLGKKVFNTY